MDDWDETEDDNIYADGSRESQVDDEQISPEEAAFMEGYDSADNLESFEDKAVEEEAEEEEP